MNYILSNGHIIQGKKGNVEHLRLQYKLSHPLFTELHALGYQSIIQLENQSISCYVFIKNGAFYLIKWNFYPNCNLFYIIVKTFQLMDEQCKICLTKYQDSQIISCFACQNNLCEHCYKKIFKCPFCRYKGKLAYMGVSMFKTTNPIFLQSSCSYIEEYLRYFGYYKEYYRFVINELEMCNECGAIPIDFPEDYRQFYRLFKKTYCYDCYVSYLHSILEN